MYVCVIRWYMGVVYIYMWVFILLIKLILSIDIIVAMLL